MNVPQHVAIILDGNGRWAKSRRHARVIMGMHREVRMWRESVKRHGDWELSI